MAKTCSRSKKLTKAYETTVYSFSFYVQIQSLDLSSLLLRRIHSAIHIMGSCKNIDANTVSSIGILKSRDFLGPPSLLNHRTKMVSSHVRAENKLKALQNHEVHLQSHQYTVGDGKLQKMKWKNSLMKMFWLRFPLGTKSLLRRSIYTNCIISLWMLNETICHPELGHIPLFFQYLTLTILLQCTIGSK